jgi:hypothetical protein
LSLSIFNVYEFVIDANESERSKATVRLILHEGYPRNIRGVPLASATRQPIKSPSASWIGPGN